MGSKNQFLQISVSLWVFAYTSFPNDATLLPQRRIIVTELQKLVDWFARIALPRAAFKPECVQFGEHAIVWSLGERIQIQT